MDEGAGLDRVGDDFVRLATQTALPGAALNPGSEGNAMDQIIDINLKGYFLCSQAAGRVMIRQRSGSILMNSSIAGSIGIQGLVPYASAKGGVNQLTRTLAVEWAPYNVRVNAFAPAYFENVMQGVEAVHNEAKERHIREWTPLGRRGRLEELIGPVVFLASDASSYVTGHILMVDGGWTAA